MAKLQIRRTGAGEHALYACIWEAIDWWRLVEVIDYRQYETEGKMNDCVTKMQGLLEKHDKQFDDVLDAAQYIKDTATTDPYRSGTFTGPIPKDSKKYRKRRARPSKLWDSVRKAVKKARALHSTSDSSPTVDTEGSVQLAGLKEQEVGRPVRDNGGNTKAQRRAQHNQNNQK